MPFFIVAIALSDFSGFCLFLLVGWAHHHLSRHQWRWSGLIQPKVVDYYHFDGSGRGFDRHCRSRYFYDRDGSWKDVELRFQPQLQLSEDDFRSPLGGHLAPHLPVLLGHPVHPGDCQYPPCPEMTLLNPYPIHFPL